MTQLRNVDLPESEGARFVPSEYPLRRPGRKIPSAVGNGETMTSSPFKERRKP